MADRLEDTAELVFQMISTVRTGDLEQVKQVVHEDTKYQWEGTFHPLFVASEEGHAHLLDYFSSLGMDINTCDENQATALYVAGQNNRAPMIEALCARGADPNKPKSSGATPLYVGSQNGFLDVCIALLKSKADVNSCRNDGCSPLWIASANGHVTVAQLLLRYKADPDLAKTTGATPIWIATQEHRVDVVSVLIDHKCDVNAPKQSGASPLWIACARGYHKLVSMLLAAGADCNQTDKSDVSPLWIAAQEGHAKVVRLLLQRNASTELVHNNLSPLFIATQNNREDIVMDLLESHASLEPAVPGAQAPLSVAVQQRNRALVQLFLEAKADPNQTVTVQKQPLSILSMSAKTGDELLTQLLLKYGADASLTWHGRTAKSLAIHFRNDACARVLSEALGEPYHGLPVRRKSITLDEANPIKDRQQRQRAKSQALANRPGWVMNLIRKRSIALGKDVKTVTEKVGASLYPYLARKPGAASSSDSDDDDSEPDDASPPPPRQSASPDTERKDPRSRALPVLKSPSALSPLALQTIASAYAELDTVFLEQETHSPMRGNLPDSAFQSILAGRKRLAAAYGSKSFTQEEMDANRNAYQFEHD